MSGSTKLGLSIWDECRLIQINDNRWNAPQNSKSGSSGSHVQRSCRILGKVSWPRTGPPDRRSKGYYGGDGLGLVIAILLILLLLGKLRALAAGENLQGRKPRREP